MDFLTAIILGLVQGLTEFLPISSSSHLILVPAFLGWEDQGLAFDVAVHLGTLSAVVAYFRREIFSIAGAWCGSIAGRAHDRQDARLGWALLVATVPLLLAGLLLEDVVEQELRSPRVIAVTTAFFGVLLWVADLRKDRVTDEHDVGMTRAVLIGLVQVLALIPGTSRSGITITAGLGLGLSRQSAARFSFLLAVPAIAGASALELWELLQSTDPVPWGPMLTGLVVAAVSAYLCIKWFLAVIQRMGLWLFTIYRLVLAGVILLGLTGEALGQARLTGFIDFYCRRGVTRLA